MTKPIYILNGPNLNLLGRREPHIYGHTTLADVEAMCREAGAERGYEVVFRQSNFEGEVVEWIHEAIDRASGVIINPAALTHTSVAVLDALKNVAAPIIELHISNPHQREPFRHVSYVTPVATGTIAGLGVNGYKIAVGAMVELIAARNAEG
jgi:3-dehydroquinate dehydratase-2